MSREEAIGKFDPSNHESTDRPWISASDAQEALEVTYDDFEEADSVVRFDLGEDIIAATSEMKEHIDQLAVAVLEVGVEGTVLTGPNGNFLISDPTAVQGMDWKSGDDLGLADRATIGNLLPEGMATSEDGVTVWRSAGGSVVITNDSTYARTGTRSQKAVTTQAAAIVSPTLGAALSQRYAVTPGRRYTFAGWVRTDTVDEVWLSRIYWYTSSNAAASQASRDGCAVVVSTGDWTFLSVSATAPADAAVASPAFARASGTTGAALWVDDSSFHAGVGGYPAAPGNIITGTQSSRSVVVTKDNYSHSLSAAQPVVVNYGGGVTWVLPNAVDNYGVMFTLINRGTGTVTISRPGTEPRTINGLVFPPNIPGHGQLQIISTGDTWRVISGEYSTNTVGKATYVWDHTANSTVASAWWRLVKYDSGWRSIEGLVVNGWTATWLKVRRATDQLMWQMTINGTGATDGLITSSLGSGFLRPNGANTRVSAPTDTTIAGVFVVTGGTLSTSSRDASIIATISHPVEDTLPTSLPGNLHTAPV